MSMVTVHGPNTMYTTGAGVPKPSTPAGATATQSPTNGLQFSFSFPNPGANPATCFDWTFTGPGSPAAQADRTSGTVTFTGPGAGTIVCTVTGATPPPANQVYTINVTAVSGAPREGQEAAAQPDMSQPALQPEEPTNGFEEYDPYDYTVAEVMEEAHNNPDPAYIQEIINAEQQGKNRSTLLTQLNEFLSTLG